MVSHETLLSEAAVVRIISQDSFFAVEVDISRVVVGWSKANLATDGI